MRVQYLSDKRVCLVCIRFPRRGNLNYNPIDCFKLSPSLVLQYWFGSSWLVFNRKISHTISKSDGIQRKTHKYIIKHHQHSLGIVRDRDRGSYQYFHQKQKQPEKQKRQIETPMEQSLTREAKQELQPNRNNTISSKTSPSQPSAQQPTVPRQSDPS